MVSVFKIVLSVCLAAFTNFLAQPNELFLGGNWVFGLFSHLPLYILLVESSRQNSARAGVLYGLVSTLSSYFWLANFGEYSIWTITAVSVIYMIFYAFFFILLHHLLADPRRPGSRRPAGFPILAGRLNGPLFFALAWTSFEFFKSRGYLAFPWNLTAFPFHDWVAMNQVAELAGVWPISFAILLLQGSLAALLIHQTGQNRTLGRAGAEGTDQARTHGRARPPARPARQIPQVLASVICAILMLLTFNIYGLLRLADLDRQAEATSTQPLLVLLVQQNADSWAQDGLVSALQQVIDLSRAGVEEARAVYGREPDIVSWSETSLSFFYPNDWLFTNPSDFSFTDYLRFSDTDLITGAPLNRGNSNYQNGVIHLNKNGDILGEYGKIHLIPFAEHIPFRDLPFFSDFLENVVGLPGGGWTSGEEVSTLYFDDLGLRIGTPICFEDSFANNTRAFVREGADILVNLTNNTWSRTFSAQMQHFVAARYRAIENRIPLLRATNGGLTSIVLPNGRVQASIPMFEPEYLLAELDWGGPALADAGGAGQGRAQAGRPLTVYTRWGDWFAWLVVIILVGVLAGRLFLYVVFPIKALNPPRGINKLLLARKKRM